MSVPQNDAVDFMRTSMSSDPEQKKRTISSNSSQNSGHLFVPNWSEIFPPPPLEQPPPIPTQKSSASPPSTSSRTNFLRQQVKSENFLVKLFRLLTSRFLKSPGSFSTPMSASVHMSPQSSRRPLPHLMSSSHNGILTRMTNENGQQMDIYENPSEHYGIVGSSFASPFQASPFLGAYRKTGKIFGNTF